MSDFLSSLAQLQGKPENPEEKTDFLSQLNSLTSPEEPKRSLTGNRISAGIDQYQAGLLGLGEAVAGKLGATDTAELFKERREQNESAADAAMRQARAQGGIESYKDVTGLGTGLNYVGGLAAQSLPYLGEALVGGIGARAAMSGTRAALRGAVEAGDVAAQTAARSTLSKGSLLGGTAASYPSAVGDILGNQREQAGETNLGAAAALGVPYAALNALGIEGALAKQQGFRVATDILDSVSGVKGALARGAVTGVGVGLKESFSETAQEGLNQAGRMVVDPNETFLNDRSKEAFMESAVGGFALGGIGGAVGGGMRRSSTSDSLLAGSTEEIGTFDKSSNNNAINKAIDSNSPELIGPPPVTASTGPNLPEQVGPPQQSVQAAQAQLEQTRIDESRQQAAQAQEQAQSAFKQGALIYGVQPVVGTTRFQVAGKTLFTQQDAIKFLQSIDQLNEGKPEEQKALIGAALTSGAVKVNADANPKTVNNAAVKFLSAYGFDTANDKTDAAQRADVVISTLEGPKALKQAEQVNNFYKSITGTNAPAFDSLMQQVDEADKAKAAKIKPAAPTTQGTPNEQLQQLQNNARVREVSVQGGTTQTGGTGNGTVRSVNVQPIGAGSVNEGSLGLQTGAVPSVGIPTSTSSTGYTSGISTNGTAQGQTQVSSERQDALAIVNQVFVKTFGSRNSDIILAVLTQEKTQAEIAKDFGISDARVNQIAGPQAQETWGDRILLNARSMGISKDEMGNLLEIISTEEVVNEEQVVNEELLTEAPTEETSAMNVDDTNIATSDEDLRLGKEEVSTGEEGGPSGFRVFNPDISGATELEDASAQNRTRRKLKTTELKNLKDFELNNLAADENTTVEELDKIVAELLRRQDIRVNKGKPDAVQKPSPKKVPVRQRAPSSEGVLKEDTEERKAASEGKQAAKEVKPVEVAPGQTDEEAAAQAWNEGAKDFPDAPKFAELTEEQQQDFISFGPENWTAEDVQTELIKLAKESVTGKTQFSRNEGAGKDETWDADGLTSFLKQMFVANKNFDNLVSIVANYDELPTYVKNVVKKSNAIQAFTYGRRVYMLADQIQIGQELPVFLHETGVHLGMENLLGTANYRKLAGQLMTWVAVKNNSLESTIAKAAQKRVDAAVKAAKQNDEQLTADEQLDELLAYFVEEAVARGVNPSALGKDTSQVAQWFRSLVAAMKIALRKIGFGKFDQLSAGNIVDLAFGAAKMEISGAYHGTSAEFRDFRTSKIGTGEGAVAFGWGLYMAERFGVANQYRKNDVAKKDKNHNATTATYKGMNRDELQVALLDAGDIDNYYEYSAVRNIVDLESFVMGAKSEITQGHIDVYIKNLEYNRDNNKIVSWDENGNPTTTLRDIEKVNKEIKAASKLKESDFGLPDAVTKGNLMKVLPMVDEESLMDLDTRLTAQPEILEKITKGFPQEVLDAVNEKSNIDLEDMTGRDLQRVLVDLENQGLTDLYFQMPDSITDSIKQGRFMSEEIVSKYLEYKLGIEGVKYLDLSSRSVGGQINIRRFPELKNFKYVPPAGSPAGKEGNFIITGITLRNGILRAVGKYDTPNKVNYEEDLPIKHLLKAQGIDAEALIEHVKDEQARQTKNVVMFKDKGVSRITTFPGGKLDSKVQYSIKKAREAAEKQMGLLPKPIRTPLQNVMDNVFGFAKKGVTWGAFTEDLADIAVKYIPSVRTYVNLMQERQAIRTKLERRVDEILSQYDGLPSESKGTGPQSANQLIQDMTMNEGGKWAYDPGWIKGFNAAKDIDPELEARFNAMPAKAQKIIKDVFAHGNNTLKLMQNAVTSNITTEYDVLINAAVKAGDVQEEADLRKKKANSLTEYRTLMRMGNKAPYAPLKRFGNYVIVGKSNQYLDAEATINDENAAPDVIAEARKKLRELEKNDDHYFVQFAETRGEAKAIAREEAKNYDSIEDFEKDTSGAYAGTDLQSTFHRLRNMVEETKDSTMSDAADRAVNRLLTDLRLTLMSEQSARQSERKRRKIHGAEKDMFRAFATQGRATAHFIASLENSGNIYDVLRQMKTETDKTSKVGTREERRRFYNEFMKRHYMGLDYQPSPFIDKALGVTSTWMLLTNPAYYLQNMTQPFMMSLPVMAGKHGYTRSWNEMTKAYADISGVIRKHGIGEKAYSELPADVRDVVEQLVNRGRIDISLEQDLGRVRSTEDSNLKYFGRATELLRNMAQDVETINRVATAVAAYRLEAKGSTKGAAINYADKIIRTTHGDYSAFNAPRITRQGLGRLATQFRKFQLIQISLMARLYQDAFRNEDPKVRLAGKYSLAYTLGHTAVMGGIMGLPGFYAISAIYGLLFGDDDEPDNPELALRRAIGDDTLADLLVKGVPAALGVDVSGKLGMGQMLSILPYTDIKFTRKDLPQAGYALLTGPFGGLTLKGADAVSYIGSGDYYKGMEQLLPSGLSQAAKGYRFASEGITTRSGDVTMSPDDISTLDALMVGLGLPTKPITDRQFVQSAKFEFDQFYNDKASEIKRAYTRASKEKDSAAQAEARDDWKSLQESRAKNGYTKQPLSTLLKAPQEQKKRERNVTGGVQFNKSNKGFVKQTSEL